MAAVTLTVVLTFAPSLSVAQEKAGSSAKSQPTSQGVAEEEQSHGSAGSIKVHGHWTIVVKNPDGSVASHHEFENALTSGGAVLLASMLTRASQAPVWLINLSFTYANGGHIVQTYNATAAVASNATVVMTASGRVPVGLGTVQVVAVQTICDQCGGFAGADFTQRNLTQPVPPSTTPPPTITALDGQSVDIAVTVSFS